MLRQKTLFVVGAGASNEVGLPIGADLRSRIIEKTRFRFDVLRDLESGDRQIISAFSTKSQKSNVSIKLYIDAAERIRTSLSQFSSIDNYLYSHEHDNILIDVGKIAIVKCILEAEHESRINLASPHDPSPFQGDISKTWYPRLSSMLFNGVSRHKINTVFENISFIVFNYDRVIEHFLFHSLVRGYALASAEAREVMKGLKIIHPYGTVGRWTEENQPRQNGRDVPFGGMIGHDLADLAECIKTFSERVEDPGLRHDVPCEMQRADLIVFLGFAYHHQNMDFLGAQGRSRPPRVIGTAYGMSDSNRGMITSQLEKLFVTPQGGGPIVTIRNDLMCAGILDEFSFMLAL